MEDRETKRLRTLNNTKAKTINTEQHKTLGQDCDKSCPTYLFSMWIEDIRMIEHILVIFAYLDNSKNVCYVF